MYDESPLVFPKKADVDRLTRYAHYDRLYAGEHFDAFSYKAEKDFTDRYARLRYIVANFCGLTSRVLADMLFDDGVSLDYKDPKAQNWSDGLWEDNQLLTQMYESALSNSRKGDDIFKIRIGQRNPQIVSSKPEIIIEQITPAIYFPEMDQMATRFTPSKDVLAMMFERNGKTYLHKETHVPGYIFHEVYQYDPKQQKIISTENPIDFGYQPQEVTGIERSLVFHIPNVRDGSGFWGVSDYKDIETLQFALNNRLTKNDNILDKHSDPILAVPPGVIDEEGRVRKESLGMFEVDNENPGFNKPEYIVWNANLEAAMKEIDKLVDLLFMFSEIAPASLGADQSGGAAESGRALKFKLLATIRKRNRKMRYYDQAIKDMMETAMELGIAHGIAIDGVTISNPERPTIKWGDGVINDNVEQVDIASTRIADGTMSRADAIVELDQVSPDDAKKKVKEIDDEAGPDLSTMIGGGSAPGAPAQAGAQPTPPAGAPVKQVAESPSRV